jgi:L-ribulose-5-phosphate 3-epimerase
VNSPWVGINLDTGNFRKHGYARVENCIPHAVTVHLKTSIADEQGQHKKADWDRILRMFATGGYKGYLALEYEEKEDPASAFRA